MQQFSDKLAVAARQNVEEEKYWLEKFRGEIVKSYFPYDSKKITGTGPGFRTDTFRLPGELFSRLTAITNNSDIRLFVTLAAGVVLLLGKYTHNSDITVGTSIYKQQADVEFINTVLPLRNRLNDNMSFKDLLMHVSQVLFEANKHQNYPMEVLLFQLNMEAPGDEDFPLFDIAVLLQNIHDRKYLQHINLKLFFIFNRTAEGIEVMVEYNSLFYQETTIEHIFSHFVNLLKNTVFNVGVPLSAVNILSEKEKKEILIDFNDTGREYSRDKTMHQLFEEQVEKTPANIAVSFNGKTLSYKDLNQRANKLAYQLRKKGVKPNDFVAITIDRSLEMIIGVMAVVKSGGAYVPLEPYLPEARLITCLVSLDAECLLTNRTQLSKIHRISKELSGLKHIFCLDEVNERAVLTGLFKGKVFIPKGEVEAGPVENLVPTAAASDIAYVIFTSGTTGTPKGVVVKHRPVINMIEWVNRTFEVAAPDKLLFVVSLSFDLSVYDIFGILASGASLRVVSSDDLKLPDRALDIIFDEDITFWDSAPAALQMLVPYLEDLKNNRHDCNNSMRLIFLSGDWIPVTMPDILKEAFDGVRVISLGGATEATVWSNYYPVGQVAPEWKSIPYGKPIQNAKYYILDSALTPCPIGVQGALYIGGECLASGYINDEVLTANKFIDNPFNPGEKMYHTGDMARWFPDGNMEFLGREDSQVKIRGFRIELGEIESQLQMHPDIEAAAALAWGEPKGDKYLCAYYVSGREFNTHELVEYLSRVLPDYMIPPYLIKVDRMPVTVNGKMDRKGFPEPVMDRVEQTYAPPRNEMEVKMAAVWADILHMEKEEIGIDSDFFELGGHSLNATTLSARIHQELEVKIPMAEIFKSPTIRSMMDFINASGKVRFVSIQSSEKKDYYMLSSSQKRLYIIQQMEPKATVYNITRVIEMENIDRRKLQTAFEKLIERHESLRTSFLVVGNEPVQRIHDDAAFEVECYALSDREQVVDRKEKIVRQFVRSFDLSQAPLMRVGLIKSNSNRYVLMVDMHHILSDAISHQILTQDFLALYLGKELPPLQLQYKDYAEWQNHAVQRETLNRQKEYWEKVFEDEVPRLSLPTDFERPEVQSFEGSARGFFIDKEETSALKELALEENVTLYFLLLAVYYIFLSKISSQEDIVVGATIAGRNHADLEKVIGMFVNMLALRNYPRGDKTFTDFLNEVKERTIETFENQDYPFDELVELLAVTKDPRRNPLFDVAFSFQNVEAETGEIPKEESETIKTQYHQVEHRVSRFDLSLFGMAAEVIRLDFEYSTKLFTEGKIERFIGYFTEILSQVSQNKRIRLRDICISHDLMSIKTDSFKEELNSFEF